MRIRIMCTGHPCMTGALNRWAVTRSGRSTIHMLAREMPEPAKCWVKKSLNEFRLTYDPGED